MREIGEGDRLHYEEDWQQPLAVRKARQRYEKHQDCNYEEREAGTSRSALDPPGEADGCDGRQSGAVVGRPLGRPMHHRAAAPQLHPSPRSSAASVVSWPRGDITLTTGHRSGRDSARPS
jgi:hypothetical protein